ncbi:MAG: SCP-2 sterol transfer family protein [Gammaproteobacteria bacterium]|nr:SCP-2 sterol transfer family protein [Gammaproteobacteria bacterium]
MAVIFSKEWLQEFALLWNADKEMVQGLKKADFHSAIAYGYKGERDPRGVIFVEDGKVILVSEYQNQALNWDLRADIMDWKTWITKGFGLANLGIAVAQGKLEFKQGEYRKMISNPSLAKPFLRHFELMTKMKTDYKL